MKTIITLPEKKAIKVFDFIPAGDGDGCTYISTDPTSQLSLSTTHIFYL